MPIAIIPMSKHYRWSLTLQGWILSSMLFGYLTSQMFGASACNRFGTKRVLTFAVLIWSLSILSTPHVAGDTKTLIFMRIMLGIGEGLCLPTIFTIFAQSVPVAERSRAFSYLIGAGTMGQTLSALLCPHLNWQWMFYTFGAAGICWSALFLVYYIDTTTSLSSSEPDPEDNVPLVLPGPSGRQKSIPLLTYISIWPLWAIYCAHFAMNWTNYIVMNWLPTYLVNTLGANRQSISLTALPYLVNSGSGVFAGHIADSLINANWSVISVRKIMTTIGLVLPALFLLLFSTVNNLLLAILFITFSMAFISFNSAGHLSNHADVAPSHAGLTFAVSNTIATIPGILAGPLTAELVTQSHGRWFPVFVLASLINLTGAVIYASQASANAVL